MGDASVIRTNKLTKAFGSVQAISDVGLDIKAGSITGFLGPNGAGKSTTINVLMGFIAPSSGEAFLFDERVSVTNSEARKQVGFLSNSIALDNGLRAVEEIEYFGHLAGGYDKKYVNALAKRLDLDLDQKIGKLSTGNYQKVGLIIALMHRPKLLILDEPTNGLDPLVQAEFNKIILELKASGSTVFISSHILSEVQELCDQFVFIKRGRIVAKLSRDELFSQVKDRLVVEPRADQRDKLVEFLETNDIAHNIDHADLGAEFMKYYEEDDA